MIEAVTYHGVVRPEQVGKGGPREVYRTLARLPEDGRSYHPGETEPLKLVEPYHSPDGFQWGYQGSGPAELARQLLRDATGDRRWLDRPDVYQRLKREFVAVWPQDRPWSLPRSTILAWLEQLPPEPARCRTCDEPVDDPAKVYCSPECSTSEDEEMPE